MALDFNFSDNPIKASINFLFNVFTWGWIAEIILICLIIGWLFLFFVIVIERKLIIYLIKDKYYYAKSYLYHYIFEKVRYIKGYWGEIAFRFQHWDSRMWTITILLLILFIMFVWFLFQVSQFGIEGGFNANQSFINGSINNINSTS